MVHGATWAVYGALVFTLVLPFLVLALRTRDEDLPTCQVCQIAVRRVKSATDLNTDPTTRKRLIVGMKEECEQANLGKHCRELVPRFVAQMTKIAEKLQSSRSVKEICADIGWCSEVSDEL